MRSRSLRQSDQHNIRLESQPPAHKAHDKRKRSAALATLLPFQAAHLSKHDFSSQKPLFALYLEVQKQMALNHLSEIEARGRWKSFVGRWNRGGLAEGWYDPATLRKAAESFTRPFSPTRYSGERRSSPDYTYQKQQMLGGIASSDDENIGPALPENPGTRLNKVYRSGPTIPSLQDLELRRETSTEDNIAARESLREQRIVERKKDKERMEELVPRAEAGTKERMMEKKREKADTSRAFALSKTEGGGVAEVPESELLGDDDGGLEGFKKQKRELERKKNEREIRREEVSRARAEEREERVKQYRAKEEATMKGLVELAKARFG
ncbi:hypothetical protein MMC27_000756 [Xylographa pallens]|nr:hypothetical protein [Xylographa pallens]